jgi:hypothetical protein
LRTKSVTSDALASLLLLEKELEPTPEPFRCQPNMQFAVDFEEYVTFCTNFLGRADLLYTPYQKLHQLTREYRLGSDGAKRELWSAFLKDMAFAVLKELYWAESFGKGASSIIHTVQDCTTMLSEQDINLYFAKVKEVILPRAVSHFTSKGYVYPPQISVKNVKHFKYAVTMFYLADQPFYWSYQ